MKSKQEKIDDILSVIGDYISNEKDPPIEVFLELKNAVGEDTEEYKNYIGALELNKRYEKTLSTVMDYIIKHLNARAEYKVDIKPVYSSEDYLERDVTVHEVLIPAVRIRFMEGMSKPVSIYLED